MEQIPVKTPISFSLPAQHMDYALGALWEPLLSPREKEVALLVTRGITNKQIAKELAISKQTVKNVLTKVFDKTKTQSRSQLAVLLVRLAYSTNRPTDGPGTQCLCASCPSIRKGLCRMPGL